MVGLCLLFGISVLYMGASALANAIISVVGETMDRMTGGDENG